MENPANSSKGADGFHHSHIWPKKLGKYKFGFAGVMLLAVFLMWLSPAQGGTITENFANNEFDTQLWGLWDTGQETTVEVANDRLEVTVAGPGYAGIGGYGFTLMGDFEIKADFTLINWPTNNGTQLYISVNNTSSNLFQVGRGNTGPTDGQEVYFTLALNIFSYTGLTGPTASGKLRLVRTGTKIEGFYWDGAAWHSIGSATDTTLGARVMVTFGIGPYGNEYSGTPAKAAFSNIQITYAARGPSFWQPGNPGPALMDLLLPKK
jgi:hypothetical protein